MAAGHFAVQISVCLADLPFELCERIAEELANKDLRNLRLVSNRLSEAATAILFEKITLAIHNHEDVRKTAEFLQDLAAGSKLADHIRILHIRQLSFERRRKPFSEDFCSRDGQNNRINLEMFRENTGVKDRDALTMFFEDSTRILQEAIMAMRNVRSLLYVNEYVFSSEFGLLTILPITTSYTPTSQLPWTYQPLARAIVSLPHLRSLDLNVTFYESDDAIDQSTRQSLVDIINHGLGRGQRMNRLVLRAQPGYVYRNLPLLSVLLEKCAPSLRSLLLIIQDHDTNSLREAVPISSLLTPRILSYLSNSLYGFGNYGFFIDDTAARGLAKLRNMKHVALLGSTKSKGHHMDQALSWEKRRLKNSFTRIITDTVSREMIQYLNGSTGLRYLYIRLQETNSGFSQKEIFEFFCQTLLRHRATLSSVNIELVNLASEHLKLWRWGDCFCVAFQGLSALVDVRLTLDGQRPFEEQVNDVTLLKKCILSLPKLKTVWIAYNIYPTTTTSRTVFSRVLGNFRTPASAPEINPGLAIRIQTEATIVPSFRSTKCSSVYGLSRSRKDPQHLSFYRKDEGSDIAQSLRELELESINLNFMIGIITLVLIVACALALIILGIPNVTRIRNQDPISPLLVNICTLAEGPDWDQLLMPQVCLPQRTSSSRAPSLSMVAKATASVALEGQEMTRTISGLLQEHVPCLDKSPE